MWFVPLLQNSLHLVDHGIFFKEYKSFILDSAEEFQFKLGPQSLKIRSGENNPNLRAANFEELIVV